MYEEHQILSQTCKQITLSFTQLSRYVRQNSKLTPRIPHPLGPHLVPHDGDYDEFHSSDYDMLHGTVDLKEVRLTGWA